MTCEEFRSVGVIIDVRTTTRALRAALANHYIACEACREFTDKTEAEELAQLPIAESTAIKALGTQTAMEDAFSNDPEFVIDA